jgi:hypothetical protein
MWVNELDPSAHAPGNLAMRGGMNGRWMIDATHPVGMPAQPRADVPEELWRSLRPEDFLQP